MGRSILLASAWAIGVAAVVGHDNDVVARFRKMADAVEANTSGTSETSDAPEEDEDKDEEEADAAPVGVGRCCGGRGHEARACPSNLTCNHTNEYWWDCQEQSHIDAVAKATERALKARRHQPPPSAEDMNAQFRDGEAADTLAASGVVIHQFHNGLDGDWKPWMPCPESCYGHLCWCRAFNDRFSTTVVSRRLVGTSGQIHMYKPESPGFVLAPWAMDVNCAYPADGGSEHKNCAPGQQGCVPGCGTYWCSPDPNLPNNMDTKCAWPAKQLEHVFAVQERALRWQEPTSVSYNEVVVRTDTWVDNLPGTIQAIFFTKGSGGEKEARAVHAAFVKAFAGNGTGATARLLEMDLANTKAPFRDVTPQPADGDAAVASDDGVVQRFAVTNASATWAINNTLEVPPWSMLLAALPVATVIAMGIAPNAARCCARHWRFGPQRRVAAGVPAQDEVGLLPGVAPLPAFLTASI